MLERFKNVNQLGLFAKFWEPGKVKTRLAATLGNGPACALYQRFLFHLLHQLQQAGQQRWLVFSPPERQADFQSAIPDSWQLVPQSNGDLGHRMASFFAFASQHPDPSPSATSEHRMVVIGADCPQLDARLIHQAWQALDTSQVVLGPSTDGGYYLIGMTAQTVDRADIFRDMPWSTDQVLPRTLERLEHLQLSYALLPEQTDVDDQASLEQLMLRLEQASESSQGGELYRQIQATLTQARRGQP